MNCRFLLCTWLLALGTLPLIAAKKGAICGAKLRASSAQSQFRVELESALKNYDRDKLLALAKNNPEQLPYINQVIQSSLREYSAANIPKNPEVVLVGAGASTAILSATLRDGVPDENRKNMLILEEGAFAVDTFYAKDFQLNSPTYSQNADANFIPNGIFQHSDLFTGRRPHSDETAFILLSNLWFSKIPVQFESKVTKVKPQQKGLSITYERDGKQHSLRGVKDLGIGTGRREPSLSRIGGVDTKTLVRNELQKTDQSLDFQSKGIYSIYSFLRLSKLIQSSPPGNKLPSEFVIIGDGHSAFVSAENIFKLWKDFPHYFDRKPKVKIIGKKFNTQREFQSAVEQSSLSHPKAKLFVDRYKDALPEHIKDGSLRGLGSRAEDISTTDENYRVELEGNTSLEAPVVVLATGFEKNDLDFLGDANVWKESDAWVDSAPTHTEKGQVVSSKSRPISRRFSATGSVGRVWPYGLANPTLNQYGDVELRNASITGNPGSFNIMATQISELGRILTGVSAPEFKEVDQPFVPGASLIFGF